MGLRLGLIIILLSVSAQAQNASLWNLGSQKDEVTEAIHHPQRPFLTKEDIRAVSESLAKHPSSRMIKGRLLTVDTRDQEACLKVQNTLLDSRAQTASDPRELCRPNPRKPIASVLVLEEGDSAEWERELNIKPLTSDQKNILTETRNVALAGLGVWGVLYLLPEDVSNWSRKKFRDDPVGQYKEHIKSGPQWDDDDWKINFIGHPYSGAVYYQVARHSGFAPLESFGYSVLMSTFYWEFGIEAFAEQPSIQDLIFTPVIGSIMGELFYRLEQKIKDNQGTVLGSKTLGSLAMIFLNPMGEISEHINRAFGSKVIQQSRARWVVRKNSGTTAHGRPRNSSYVGLELQLIF